MASLVVSNNVESTVADNPLSNSATTVNVAAGEGANYPSTFPYRLTIWDKSSHSDPSDDSGMEIVECTSKTSDALTIVREKEGTSGSVHPLNSAIALLITAGLFNDATYGITTKLDTIETDAKDDQTASEVPNTPAGTIVATDVQAAIDELDTEKETPAGTQTKVDTHAADTSTHGVAEVADKATVSTEIDNDITTHAALDTGVHGAGASTLATIDDLSAAIPSGVIFPFGGAAAPSGYLLCNGAAVSRATYSDLFAVTGVVFGVGDGSTTFNVPDMQGNIPVGKGGSGVTNIGDAGGEQTHTLSLAETPSHNHTTPSRGSDGTNTTILRQANAGGVSNTATSSQGSGNAHQNMQPYVGTEYIIKT